MVAGKVPVIDGSKLLSQNTATVAEDLVQQVADALSSWGFFQLINHGVDQDFLQQHLGVTKRFFELPAAAKEPITRRRDNAMGFCSTELTKQKLDIKQVFDFRSVTHPDLPDDHPANHHPSGVNQWPDGQQQFRELNQRFITELTRLASRLLEVIAMSLGLPSHALHSLFQPADSSRVRLNHYPVTPDAPEDSFGVSHHKDSGFLTVLLQDEQVSGLQVFHDGDWHLIEPISGALTINAGDMLQVLSNDRFIAANHRVLRSSSRPRYSRVLFFNPDINAALQPWLAEGSLERPHYRPFSYRDFYLARLDGNYADLGEEVQIDWYRIKDDTTAGGVPAAGTINELAESYRSGKAREAAVVQPAPPVTGGLTQGGAATAHA